MAQSFNFRGTQAGSAAREAERVPASRASLQVRAGSAAAAAEAEARLAGEDARERGGTMGFHLRAQGGGSQRGKAERLFPGPSARPAAAETLVAEELVADKLVAEKLVAPAPVAAVPVIQTPLPEVAQVSTVTSVGLRFKHALQSIFS